MRVKLNSYKITVELEYEMKKHTSSISQSSFFQE